MDPSGYTLPSSIGAFAHQERSASMLFGAGRQYDPPYEEQGLSSAANVPFFSHTTNRDDGSLDNSSAGYEGYRGSLGADDGLDAPEDSSLRALGAGGVPSYPGKLGISSAGAAANNAGFSMLDTYSLESSMVAEIGKLVDGVVRDSTLLE